MDADKKSPSECILAHFPTGFFSYFSGFFQFIRAVFLDFSANFPTFSASANRKIRLFYIRFQPRSIIYTRLPRPLWFLAMTLRKSLLKRKNNFTVQPLTGSSGTLVTLERSQRRSDRVSWAILRALHV